MKENNPEESQFYQKLIQFTENNKKTLLIAGAAVVLFVSGITLYTKYVSAPKQKEAIEHLAKIQDFFQLDSFNYVVNGAVGLKSAVQIASEFSRTSSGNLANYYAGVSYLNLGDFDNAIKFLKKFESNGDKVLGAMALACIGDAHVEKGEMKEGLNFYVKAVNYNEPNELTTPIHLRKAIYVFMELKEFDKALALVNEMLKTEDLQINFKNELNKYQGFLEAKTGTYSSDVSAK